MRLWSVNSGSASLYSNLLLWLREALLGVLLCLSTEAGIGVLSVLLTVLLLSVLRSGALTVVTLSDIDLGLGVLSGRTVSGTVLSVVRLILNVDLGVDVASVRLLIAIG